MKLSILIPTLIGRDNYLNRISNEIRRQYDLLDKREEVEIRIVRDNRERTTGAKRNQLIKESNSDYIAFVDDDDMITDCYIQKQLDVANSDMDCGSLNGLYFINGMYGKPFIHSIKYHHWWADDKNYYRNPNHLNCIKREIALQVPYENITIGEDGKYSEALQKSGLVKTEYEIKETLYLYYDRTK